MYVQAKDQTNEPKDCLSSVCVCVCVCVCAVDQMRDLEEKKNEKKEVESLFLASLTCSFYEWTSPLGNTP